MSTQSKTATAAKIAAREDALPTGPAGLPGTKPVGVKPRLAPEIKAARMADQLANHERLLDARVQNIVHFMSGMGVASLAGRITEYTDVSPEYAEACLVVVRESFAKCEAALKARSALAPAVAKANLQELAAKLKAQSAAAVVPAPTVQ
jgi:hypothetical protein